MKYVKFTDKQTGKPLWIREDQVLGWFPEKAHYRITPAFDEVDVDVRENGEQILAIMEDKEHEDDNGRGSKTVKGTRQGGRERTERPRGADGRRPDIRGTGVYGSQPHHAAEAAGHVEGTVAQGHGAEQEGEK